MGVLKTITDEYFGDSIRKEDKIDISGLDVEIVSFKDNNGKLHKNGYRVKDGDHDEMAKTLKKLINRVIELRGPECDLNDIDVSNIKKMCCGDEYRFIIGVFRNSPFNGDVSGWDVSNVEDMRCMFLGAKYFNQPLDKWDVSSVENMSGMFSGAESFNQDISGWNVSSVEDMGHMFHGAKSFNQPLDKWDVSSVKNMISMFCDAKSFNQDISGWDVSNVEDMNQMFWNAKSFNQDISGWNVSRVKNMFVMFHGAESFNQDISGWDILSVKYMSGMFDYTPLESNNKLPKWYLDK